MEECHRLYNSRRGSIIHLAVGVLRRGRVEMRRDMLVLILHLNHVLLVAVGPSLDNLGDERGYEED